MIIITVIGWYGSETIGDRAIFAGLLKTFTSAYKDFKIKLGSIHPFYTERTINEDYNFWKTLIHVENIDIELFDIRRPKQLSIAIAKSDLLIIGGGPLMDLKGMYYLNYAFKYAKRKNVKTAILGCGIGPLYKKEYIKQLLNIINNSNLTILRDDLSFNLLSDIINHNRTKIEAPSIRILIDPSIIALMAFKNKSKLYERNQDIIIVNIRYFPRNLWCDINYELIERFIHKIIKDVALRYQDKNILLLPNHYFYRGGDDRLFMNELKHKINIKNIHVQNSPLSLEETLLKTQNCFGCIGMRFHSIVFQTILNGNNYFLDYTDSSYGKIAGFLHKINATSFYSNRSFTLQNLKTIKQEYVIDFQNNKKFDLPLESLSSFETKYSDYMKNLFY